MKRYIVNVDVLRATGRQSFSIEAESPEDAIILFGRGQGECVYEELEAQDFGTPTAVEQ